MTSIKKNTTKGYLDVNKKTKKDILLGWCIKCKTFLKLMTRTDRWLFSHVRV